nr:leukocyte elastase inhibitor-like [Rhipicephalus microplus]
MNKTNRGKKLSSPSSRKMRVETPSVAYKTNPDAAESTVPTSSWEIETLGCRNRRAARRNAKLLQNENDINDAMLQFAVDVYMELRAATGAATGDPCNVIFSPFAVQTVMAMMMALSGGTTAEQLAEALHLQNIQDEDFKLYMQRRACKLTCLAGGFSYFCFNNKTQLITGRHVVPRTAPGDPLRTVTDSLLVEHRHVDFAQDGESVRESVNEWLHVMSAFECENAIPQGTLDETTSLLVVSVTSLRTADWKWKFHLRDTTSGIFYESSGVQKEVSMMYQRGRFPTADCDDELDATVLELRYRRYKKSMVLLLPHKRNGLSTLETALTGPRLQSCLDRLQDRGSVDVRLPKFAVKQTFDLKDVLPGLGVLDVFVSGIADMSSLASDEVDPSSFSEGGPHLSIAVQCVSLQTKEKGHKVGPWEDKEASITFTVDHPFMFVVLSRDPEAILLMGSVREVCLPYI